MIMANSLVSINNNGTLIMLCYVGANVCKKKFADDIEIICGIKPQIGDDNCSINIPEKLASAIYQLEPNSFSIGKPVDKPFLLPNFLTQPKCPLIVVREFLGGLFGGDGITVDLWETSDGSCRFRNVGFFQKKSLNQVNSIQEGFNILKDLLKLFGISSKYSIKVNEINSSIVAILEIYGGKNIVQFNDQIGFRYDSRKATRLAVAASYYRPKEKLEENNEDTIFFLEEKK